MAPSMLYYPTVLDQNAPVPERIKGASEVRFNSDDGNVIHGLYWPAPESQPTILLFHGNAGTVFHWAAIRDDFAPLNSGLLIIDYPGYGKSTGSPTEASVYAAGKAALDWLKKEKGLSERDIIIFGISLGGGVASQIALKTNARALILESTFRSIPLVAEKHFPLMPTDTILKSERFETYRKLPLIKIPVLFIHGTADKLVPAYESKANYELANEPKEIFLVEKAGHNDVSRTAGKAYGQTIKAWLEKTKELPLRK